MDEKICTCTCHIEGMEIMHITPCCEYTYQKYLNLDGTINIEKYNQIKNG